MKKRHGVVISKTGLIIGLLSLSLVAIAGQAHAAIQCYDCHGDRQAGILKPKDTYLGAPKLRDEATGAFLGNHQTHLGAVPSAADCVKCHNNQNYTNSHATAGNFKIQINPKLNNFSTSLGAAKYGKPTSFDQTSVPVTATCSNVNCHFVSKPTDQWGTAPYATADTTTCNKCHDAIPNSHAHTKHISLYGNDLTSCTNCHTNHAAEAKPFQHATSAGRPITVINGYTGSNNAYLPGQINRVVGTCSAASCHANVYGAGSVATPAWNSTGNGCSACHSVAIGASGPATGSHALHNVTDCTQCHATGTTATTMPSTGHADGNIDVTDGYPANVTKHVAGTYTGTCSTASCHSNVYGAGSATTPVWGSTGNGCAACHAVAIAATGPATGSHAKHNVTDCTQCHAAGTTATTVPSTGHADGNIDITAGYPANVTKHTAGSYTGTCSTASCHANVYGAGTVTTPVWGVSATGCTACHSVAIGANGPATGSHALTGHATACTACHAAGTSATTMPSSGHADGDIDVANVGYPANIAKHASGSGYTTCSTASCHANVYGTGSATSPAWGSTGNGCTACHSVAIDSTGPATGSHAKHNVTDCTQCHAAGTTATTVPSTGHGDGDIDVIAGYPANVTKHAAGSFTGTCSTASCHANVYGAGTVTTPVWGVSATGCTACHSVAIGANGPTTGSHTIAGHAAACTACHAAGTSATTTPSTGHADGDIDVANVGYPANVTKHASGTGYTTCSTASCHANVYGTGSATSPAWGSTGNGCSACHSVAIAATGPATGSHAKHNVTDCTQCHAAGTNATTVPSTGHADGDIDITAGYPANVTKHTAGSYTGTCSTASCHANVYGSGTVTTPAWGVSATGCTACHTVSIGANGPNTGSHTAHAGKACTSCHAAGTSATTMPGSGHNDNNITVTVGSYPTTVAKHTAGSGYSTCSNISCHSNGYFTAAAAQWGTTLNCKGCHATLSAGHTIHVSTLLDDRASTLVYDRYSANASSDTTYKFGCANCHPVTIASHINGSVDVDLATTAGSGSLKASNPGTATYDMAGTKKCSNVYCHSNGYAATKVYTQSPAWGGSFTGDRCAGCHGNSPNAAIIGSPAHSSHAVGIHYDDIFDGMSGKYGYYSSATKPSAHGDPNQATIISCDICHTDTVATAAAGKNANDKNSICVTCHSSTSRTPAIKRMAHINGTVDVKFASVNVRSKAQIRETSFSSYTSVWSRTSYKVDSGSYDTAKKSLTQATFTAAGVAGQGTCATVSCHNGYTVKWNDSLTCESCHSRL